MARTAHRVPMKAIRHPRRLARQHAIVAAISTLISASGYAAISSTGATFAFPGNFAIGPGDTDIGNVGLFVGSGGAGSLLANGGSLLRTGSLLVGPSASGNGDGITLIEGAGTRVELVGDGFATGVINRLDVGEWGRGGLTVAGGAVLDGRANASACLGVNHYCNNFIGTGAGSDGNLTVTGAGSQASFLRFFGVGGVAVFHPPIDTFTFGTPGATTHGRVNVLAGGSLTTDNASLGLAPGGSSPLGNERSFADATIDGANSIWRVTGGTLENTGAVVSTAAHRNAVATLSISNGGQLKVEGRDGLFNAVNLTANGGRTDMLVAGADSRIAFTGDTAVLHVGRRLGSAQLTLQAGGGVTGVWYTAVGRDGSFGEMVVDGAGTVFSATGLASAAAAGSAQNPVLDIGRNGTGVVTVSRGGRIELTATEARVNGPQLNLGREAASAGTLNISGLGSVVQLTAQSVVPGGGPNEAFNPFVRIGRDGSGTLSITDGGKLLIDGHAVSTVADSRSTSLFIGGTGDAINGGRGIALVSGAGSEIRLTGSDTYIGVGHGPQSSGQLTVADLAAVSAIGMNVGRSGGVGVLRVDHAALNFSGQQTGGVGGVLAGAFLSIGRSGGIGVADFANGSVVTLNNMGTAGASLNLGGTFTGPLGDGSLTVSGGSQVRIQAAPGLAMVSVGRDGSALLRVKGASTIDAGDGNFYVARLPGSDGTVIATEASTITAGWVGVGRDRTAAGSVDGGTGTMILNGATLNAQDVVIGTNGFLGGTAGSINVTGSVTNYGIFSPGNSPGLFTIKGNYTAGAGSRLILEVQADGAGGFMTDRVIFSQGSMIDLATMGVEFRFLGNTDPNAFQASGGFDIDTFVALQSSTGVLTGLADAAYGGVRFSARADSYAITGFTFTAGGGATFTATPVPEPSSWALMLAGGALLAAGRRRQRLSVGRA